MLNEERLRFYTNITHELRTPLTLILGPLEDLLSDKDLSSRHTAKIQLIHDSSTRLLNLINGILEFRKTETQNRKLSVENNIRAVLQMTNTSQEYQREKLESLISEFRLEKVRKNLGDQLSGGERRRTEIARCLAIDPKFIMLDEPFAGVDPIAVEDIQSIVYRLKEKNIGILITDHNAQETLRITDRAYLLFEGKILFQENPTVREKYLGRDFMFYRKKFDYPEN